jgi:hypothetical protein
MTPQEILEIELSPAQDELIWQLANAANKEIPANLVDKRTLGVLKRMDMVGQRKGFLHLRLTGQLYYSAKLADRHDIIPSVILHWALDVLERHTKRDLEIGIGAGGMKRGENGGIAYADDAIAGFRRWVDETYTKPERRRRRVAEAQEQGA